MMFATTDAARRSSAFFGGLLLAALLSGADLAAPSAAAAQGIVAEKALLGQFDARFEAIGSRSARDAEPRYPSPEAALLGKIEAGQAGERVGETGTERRAFINPASFGGEQALLGRRSRVIS